MTRKRRHQLVIEVECLDPQGQRQAQDRVHNWFETFGHTACSHGFVFKTVGVMTGKQIASHIRVSRNHEEEDEAPE
jgi:hypothetical protein